MYGSFKLAKGIELTHPTGFKLTICKMGTIGKHSLLLVKPLEFFQLQNLTTTKINILLEGAIIPWSFQ